MAVWARVTARLLRLPAGHLPDDLRAELADAAPGFRERVATFQKGLRDAGGAGRAADALHHFVASRQGAQRQRA